MKKKKYIIAVQANALNTLKVNTDTTLMLCLEAQKRGYKIFWYHVNDLSIDKNKVSAKGYFVKFFEKSKNFFLKNKKINFDLSKSKYILIRQNPPFNMEYINSTLYLEKLISSVKIINNPIAIRNISEKFYSTKFFKYMPPTVLTKDINIIKIFYKKYRKIVIKPIHGYAGKGILFLNNTFKKKEISKLLHKNGHAMVQKFLPNVKKGDKRVFIINGKVCGAIRRIPSKNSILSNISQGGTAVKTTLNSKQNKISSIIAKDLLKNQIYFAGIDFVSNYLIGDINVTSPTGLPQYKDLTGINLGETFWDNLEN